MLSSSSAWSLAESRTKKATLFLMIFSHSFGNGRAFSRLRCRSLKNPSISQRNNTAENFTLALVPVRDQNSLSEASYENSLYFSPSFCSPARHWRRGRDRSPAIHNSQAIVHRSRAREGRCCPSERQ